MSALQENRSYGLSSSKLSCGYNVSVLHVKLTDSAARAISSFQNSKGWSSHPTICFNGNQGKITVPCSENGDEWRTFTFGVTNVPHDNPRGSFNCFQQNISSAAEELSCLGVVQKKMTVNATDDSYDKARQSMAQAEEETRSRGAIVIKQGGRYQGKKVTVRAPAPALASLPKPQKSLLSNIKKGVGMAKLRKGPCAANRKSVDNVQKLPLRERVTHLLALRTYKKPELILRLRKDGLSAGDKEMLDSLLIEICQHSRDSSLILKDTQYKELHKDWSGYTSGDKQLLKRILIRRLFKPQQKLLSVPEAKVSPLRDTPNSSPAHRPKHSLPEEYTDPLLSKKPRISHLASKMASEKLGVRPSPQGSHKDATEARGKVGQRNSVDPQSLCESLSVACQQEAETAKRLEPCPCAPEESKTKADPPQPNLGGPPTPLIVPDKSKHTMEKKRRKHKHKVQEKDRLRDKKARRKEQSSDDANKVSLNSTEPSNILIETTMFEGESDVADYLMAYTRIHSQDQRQRYKQDFNREYSEYRDLHARIDSMMRQFMKLDSRLKQLHHDSHKYKTVHKKILQKYCKIKKSNPNYNVEKTRCEYLHNKLAHIKKLISEYDQWHLDGSQSPPNGSPGNCPEGRERFTCLSLTV